MPRWLVAPRTLARRSLPLTMAVVVVVFVGASVYSQLLLGTDADALDIAGNSAPSIAALADVRSELRSLSRIAASSDGGGSWPEHRRRLQAALDDYERTPDYPGEAALAAVVRDKLAALDAVVARGAPAADREAAVDALDGAIFDLSELNRRHLVASEQSIARGGRRRNLYAFFLDGIAIVIAALATLLAARTVDRYLARIDRRTRELEHLAIQVGHDIANPLAPIQVALHRAAEHADEADRAGLERAQRSLARIRQTIERLIAFARAGIAPTAPMPRSALRPALVEAARAAGCQADADADLYVPFDEARLRDLLCDLLGGSARPGLAAATVEVSRTARSVRLAVTRAGVGDGADPFDPQLHAPDAEHHPGIDLRLATVRRAVEAAGGAVGVRRTRRTEQLWVELPRA